MTKLKDAQLRKLNTPGKHFDGSGLFLHIKAEGGRLWRMKYRFAGKEKLLAFGAYPEVGLKDAREKRDEARKLLAQGIDPGAAKKAAKAQAVHDAATTFRIVAEEWLTHQAGRWEAVTLERTRASLKADVYPTIGDTPMAEVSTRQVMALVKAIEKRGAAEIAMRVLQRIKAVYRYAVTHECIESNPMADLRPGEILKARRVQHRPALAFGQLPAFLRQLKSYNGDPHTLGALRLLMLTATRPGEVRGARWSEFDLENAVWRIPAERMKMRAEHVVPLSSQAVAVVKGMKPLSGSGELVFPSPFYPSKPLSENTLNSALTRLGYKNTATAHGFRSTFSTVANEAGWQPDVIERQLAHAERNQVRAAYNRSLYLQERTQLVQWWADLLDSLPAGANVVHTRGAA